MFYTGDWMKDPNLSKCSAATRGIWMDLLCAMHENGRTGIITGSVAELAQMCRCSEQDMRHTIVTLRKNEVAEIRKCDARLQKVTVVNRRMNREYKAREAHKLRTRKYRAKEQRDANVTSPSSCSSSDKRIVSKDLSKSRESSSVATGTLSEDFSQEYLDDLQDRKTFAHLDVRWVLEKFLGWCNDHEIKPTRSKFLGWLNREIPNRKGNGADGDDDDRGTSAQAKRVAANLERDN
jgi:hypothetical protein